MSLNCCEECSRLHTAIARTSVGVWVHLLSLYRTG